MEPRIDYRSLAPEAAEALRGLNAYVRRSGLLEPSLVRLVEVRASQINGCAFCLDMHTQEARLAGEGEQRLYALAAWREAPFYTPRERAALAWTEAVTRLEDGHVPDEVYQEARRHFSERELVDLTLAVVAINGWNRLNVAFRTPAGTWRPPQGGAAPS
ncbi:MAG: carboxymuconolactone decarboxylase family protein [Bacillota bacterium]|nr:carboxymuconolactone decarboxylase family protein [Bacillota bacterium]